MSPAESYGDIRENQVFADVTVVLVFLLVFYFKFSAGNSIQLQVHGPTAVRAWTCNETRGRTTAQASRTYLSMLAHAAPTRNAWRLRGFLVMCLVIGCQCPTTLPVAAEGPQSMQRALEMGAAGDRGAPVCFRGARTESQAPYDACLAAAPDSVCGGGRWCAAVPAAMLGRTIGRGRSGRAPCTCPPFTAATA